MRIKRLLVALLLAALLLPCIPAVAEYSMPYYIHVDLTNQIVTIYNTGDKTIHRQMLCSAGVDNKTPTGVYYMPEKDRPDERTEWYWMPNAYTWVKWPTKFYYAYFFHSIPFNKQDDDTMNRKATELFGNPASHGCIRLRVEDAYYIAKNCKKGTYVKIFKSGERDEALRSLLYVSSYFEEDGISYSEFLGISENDLGRGSSGLEVQDLQHRLHDLGYYDGEYDGAYGTDTISAVKKLQKDLGVSQTGISTKDLLGVIYSNDAPVSAGATTIRESESGPVVKKLQIALQKLGIYAGDIDGIYDVDVIEAVKTFQTLCGFTVDGVAGPETQYAAYYMLDKLQKELGGENLTCSFQNEEVDTAVINSKTTNIIVREKMSTKSNVVSKVKHGDNVLVLGIEDKWARILIGNKVGYIGKKYLSSPGKTYNPIVVYTGANGASYTLGDKLEVRLVSGSKIAEEIHSHYSNESFMGYLNDADVTYATVNTGSDDVTLNLRMEPDFGAQIIDALPNSTSMRVLERGETWSKVVYNAVIGYTMSQYLSFWQGKAEDEADVLATQQNAPTTNTGEPIRATIIADGSGRAPVYAAPSEDASIISRAPADLEVKVLSFNESTGWVLIEYEGNQGYMHDASLRFTLGPEGAVAGQ